MWFVPTVQDMRCVFAFIVLSALSFLCGHFFIIERPPDSKVERMQAIMLLYGSVQSLIGFVGGFYVSKLLYATQSGYCVVRPDDITMDI